MSRVSDEVLMAYADGELTPEECQTLERMLRHDPVLRQRMEPFIRTRAELASAFGPTLHEPVPERLIAAIRRARPPARASASGLPFGGRLVDLVRRVAAALMPDGMTPALAASVAALVVAGAAAGWMAGRGDQPASLIVASGSHLVAGEALAEALETNPSGTESRSDRARASVVPVLSFRTADNTVCREYRVRTAEADRDFAGLACRDAAGAWRIAQHVETPKQAASPEGYQTATGAGIASIDAMVEAMISGEAFGTDDETRLLATGWQGAR